jgi:hypothetical protein
MSDLENKISAISNTVEEWLRPDNADLKQAIERTVDEGLFSFEDIKHRILVLKQSLRHAHLQTWAEKSDLRFNSLAGKNVLCLHAGNLPLVGIQDLLAVVMTGACYTGKISRKDPCLLPTFLKILRDNGLLPEGSLWNTQISDLKARRTDALLFAGSRNSVGNVYEELHSLKLISPGTPSLMRTAHFSVAYITDTLPRTMEDLTEAVFRYGGAGCRSVAVVVAPFHLNSQKCSFTDYVEAFWLSNPQHEKPPDSLRHRFAFNKAMEIPQAWLQDFLIEETLSKPEEKFVLHWVQGDIESFRNVIESVQPGLQSVYSTAEYIGRRVGDFRIEPLSEAQSPPVWWKPDQMDTIEWLQNRVGEPVE